MKLVRSATSLAPPRGRGALAAGDVAGVDARLDETPPPEVTTEPESVAAA